MLFLVLEKRPAERKKYLSEIATAYTSLVDEGEARAQSAVRAAEPSPGEQAEAERTSTVPKDQPWQLPGTPVGAGVHGPFNLEGDKTFTYYWDQNDEQYIAYRNAQPHMIPIPTTNTKAVQKLQPAFEAYYRSTQPQGE